MAETVGIRSPGGWKSMPFILGAETLSRLSTFGYEATFIVYLLKVYHMDLGHAFYVFNIWTALNNFTPLAGAFFADSIFGRFKTMAGASFATLLGIIMMTLTAWVPSLHPPPCSGQCQGSNAYQITYMAVALGLLSIGAGGSRPCNIPFGVDQFDRTSEAGQKSIRSFYNWYYTSFSVAELITLTIIVCIQDKSWLWGYAILIFLMATSIIILFAGTRMYIQVKPMGSVFAGIVQVFVAAYRKRSVILPSPSEVGAGGVFYDPPVVAEETRLPRTDNYRWLNKAAVVLAGDLGQDGFPTSKWKLSSIQEVEEVKCLVKILPVWASGIFIFSPIVQQGFFAVNQANLMDRHLGPQFEFPVGSVRVIQLLTIGLWVPLYELVMVPALRKVTHREGGITQLQRVGAGSVLSILGMVVAGATEWCRRDSDPEGTHMSAMWLAPQLILTGISEACNIIGQIDFYNSELPYRMRTLANSLVFASVGVAGFLGNFTVKMVHNGGRNNWLTKNINHGRLDFYYYLLAGIGVLNFGLFLFAAKRYKYKPVQVSV